MNAVSRHRSAAAARVRTASGAAVAAGLLGLAAPLAAAMPADTLGAGCPRGRISAIWVDNHSVFDLSDPSRSRRFDWAFRLANRLHVETREAVIRRELTFREGDCYDAEVLRESERVLRATDFIADVDIFGVRQPDGSHHVVVYTRDEWSTRVEVQTGSGTGLQLTGIALREDNLLGTGRRASAFALRSREERVYGLSYANPQLFGSRWRAGVAAGRTPVGSMFRETIEYPFIGEAGRWAFRHHLEHHERYFAYLAPDGQRLVEVLMPERRRSFDVGSAVRFGRRGRLTLLGALLEGEWISYPSAPALVDGEAAAAAPNGDSLYHAVDQRVDSVADVRLVVLFGQRNVYFVRRRALDTVNGTEDVRLGVDLELGLGRSLRGLSSHDDLLLHLGLFAGGQMGYWSLVGTRLFLEGRRDYAAPAEASEWVDVFGQWDSWLYWRPRPESRHTLVAGLAASGGWHPRAPFQLTLGGMSGLRGQPAHLAPGARRLVASLEARSYLGWPHPELFDLGSVVFVDAGRIWAGEVPFGVNAGFHVNAGVGLRAAFPPRSHNTLRLDVGVPLSGPSRFSDVVFSVGIGQAIGRAVRYDSELTRSARYGMSTPTFPVRSDRDP